MRHFLIACMLAFSCHGQAGTLISLGGEVNGVVDSSCTAVKTAMQVGQASSGWYVVACSTDPVVAGTTVSWINVNTKNMTSWMINSISAPAPVANSPAATPFDYVRAGAVFSFFFTFVVACWYVSKNIGVVLNAIRRF